MRWLPVFLVLHFLCVIASAQKPFHRDLPLNESGAPVRVNDTVFDAHGYLWLGTENGLYRYDGQAFALMPDSTGKPVTVTAYDGQTLFVGYSDGRVGQWSGNGFRLQYAAGVPISFIMPTALGLLIGTQGEGVILLQHGHATRFTTASGLSDDYVYSIAATLDSETSGKILQPQLLIGTDRGITVVSPGDRQPQFTRLNAANTPGLDDNIVRVIRKVPGTVDWFLAGTQSGGYCLLNFSDGRWSVGRFPEWGGGQINDAIPVSNFEQIIASEKGLWMKRTDEAEQHLLNERAVTCVLRDNIGNLWLGTHDGLTIVTADYLAGIDPGPLYRLRSVSALATTQDGLLWYAQDEQLYSYDTSTGSRPRFTAPETITSLYADVRSRLWIGTLGGGLQCVEGGRVRTIANVENLRGGHILHIAGRADTLWVSSLNGVEVLYAPAGETGSLRVIGRHGRSTGAGSDYVYQLYPDKRGRLWMATDGAGVVMWDGQQYHSGDSSSGFRPRVVYSVAEDTYGNIWAGTLEGGLYRWDGRQWSVYQRRHGLQDNTVLAVVPSANGSLVVVNEKGTDQWIAQSGEFRQYSRRMGLHIDSFSKVLNAAARDEAGKVYVPYEHGFLVLKAPVRVPDLKPRIALRAVELFFKPVDTNRYEFKPDENGIGFRFDGIHFASPERIQYRYRLDGYNDDWILTGDEMVTFPRLPSGRYSFRVQAALQSGFQNAATATYSLRIAAPLWKRPWFWAVVVIIGTAAGYYLLKRRDHARHRLASLEQARLRAEYEHLKSQVNPHFLFNSLNTLVGLIEEDPHSAARYTQQLSDFFRDTLSFRDRDLVLLEEEWDVVQKYLYIQQSRFGNALRLQASIPEDVLHTRRIIPLALQLLIENAIKHNIVSRAHPLIITIAATKDSITVSNPVRSKAVAERSSGMGLQNIRSRYALLNAGPVMVDHEQHQFSVTLPLL